MSARERLNLALLEMAEAGEATPCQGRRRDRWTSDDHADREWAANVCVSLACPVLDDCRLVGAEEKHPTGAWGGVDRAQFKQQRRTTAMTWNKSKRIVPGDWKTRKARVLARHGRICGECGHGQADEVDHVLNVARGGSHDYDNLQPIHGNACPDCGRRCHVDKTKAEAQAARDAMWAKTKRPLPKHPGLL